MPIGEYKNPDNSNKIDTKEYTTIHFQHNLYSDDYDSRNLHIRYCNMGLVKIEALIEFVKDHTAHNDAIGIQKFLEGQLKQDNGFANYFGEFENFSNSIHMAEARISFKPNALCQQLLRVKAVTVKSDGYEYVKMAPEDSEVLLKAIDTIRKETAAKQAEDNNKKPSPH